MVGRSKQGFTTYLKYKQLYIEASANHAGGATGSSREVKQYAKLAEQHLKAYHEIQSRIRDARQAARGASSRCAPMADTKLTKPMGQVPAAVEICTVARCARVASRDSIRTVEFASDARKWVP